jgi:hypothetical protein
VNLTHVPFGCSLLSFGYLETPRLFGKNLQITPLSDLWPCLAACCQSIMEYLEKSGYNLLLSFLFCIFCIFHYIMYVYVCRCVWRVCSDRVGYGSGTIHTITYHTQILHTVSIQFPSDNANSELSFILIPHVEL